VVGWWVGVLRRVGLCCGAGWATASLLMGGKVKPMVKAGASGGDLSSLGELARFPGVVGSGAAAAVVWVVVRSPRSRRQPYGYSTAPRE
jgi:hypothetical protein